MKKLLCFLLSLVVLVSCMTAHVMAANVTEANTTVRYTVESGYTVSIPAQFSVNDSEFIDFTVSNLNLNDNEKLYVSVDTTKTPVDSQNNMTFYKDDNSGETLPCGLVVGSLNESGSYSYNPLSLCNYNVAVFENGSNRATQFGRLKFIPVTAGVSSGTYIGTVYFTIEIVSA